MSPAVAAICAKLLIAALSSFIEPCSFLQDKGLLWTSRNFGGRPNVDMMRKEYHEG